MLAIPVIEVKAGRCVHTQSGNKRNKVIHDDPHQVFSQLVEEGANQIQVVDVDAIRNRQPEHLSLIGQFKKSFPETKIQLTGGVTNSDDIQIWLDSGADLVTVGGRLLRQMDELELILVEFGQQLIVALDVRASIWAQGYCPMTGLNIKEWAQVLEDENIPALMFTEIPETGRVNGHSLQSACQLASEINLPVIAHGGVLSRDDLEHLKDPCFRKLHGVTVGKPIFDGVFSFGEAVSVLKH